MDRNVRHALFCKITCYHVEQERNKREKEYTIWSQQQQALACLAAQKADEAQKEAQKDRGTDLSNSM
jgi:hypothetical protein